MMRLRGRFCLFVIFVVLISPGVFAGIPPVHENFEQANQDLYAVIAFLTDTKMLCEDSLENSLLSNCTITFNQTLKIHYSQENANISTTKSDQLQDKLSYSAGILDTIKDKAGSYYYLKDVLLPMKDLGFNVTSFVQYHQKLLLNLTRIVRDISEGNDTGAIVTFMGVKSLLFLCKSTTQKLMTNLDAINQSFSVEALRNSIVDLDQMLERYDSYLNALLGFYLPTQPFLSVYALKEDVYLDEEIQLYGFFIADRSSVVDHPIDIYFGDQLVKNTRTNGEGKFNFTLIDLMGYSPGDYTISTSTTYNHTVLSSNTVFVTIHKIPTKISLFIPSTDYSLNEPISLSGKLLDYKNRGLAADLSLYVAGFTYSVTSAEDGSFSYVFTQTLAFGSFPAYVSFNPKMIYEPSESNVVTVHVNTPTLLTIYAPKNRFFLGENIQLHGTLTSIVNNRSLSNKTIEIFSNNERIGFATINSTGVYNFTYQAENLHEGAYTMYAVFDSKEKEWRSASSDSISISVLLYSSQSFVSSRYFIYVIVVAVIFSVILLVFLFRKRLPLLQSKKKPSQTAAVLSKRLFEKICADENGHTIDFSAKKNGDFKDAIVSRYNALLRFLTTQGIMFIPSSTHLDIKNELLKKDLPKKAIENLTETFEIAMYSTHPLNEEDVSVFNVNMLNILKNLLEKDRWTKVLHEYINS